jgi:hypothetical protein
MTRDELKDHLETIEGHVRQMTEEVSETLEELREDRASFRAELREDRASFRAEVGEDHASFRDEVGEDDIGEVFDRIRRDVTRTLYISFGIVIVFVTAITFLALHLVG